MIFLSFSLAKYFNDYIDYNNEHNIPPVFFIHTKCVFFKPHNNISIKYNDIKNKTTNQDNKELRRLST